MLPNTPLVLVVLKAMGYVKSLKCGREIKVS